jgi:hypothetical protein
MAEIKKLLDEFGVIYQANKILPKEFKLDFLEALAELENNECHKTGIFPKTNLHKVTGIKQAIYRAYIHKISGWRLHVQYKDGCLVLKDIIEGQAHDDVIKVIKAKKNRYD